MATPSPDKLAKLAELYGVTTDYLLGRTTKPEIPDYVQEIMREGLEQGVSAAFKRAYGRTGGDPKALQELSNHLDKFRS